MSSGSITVIGSAILFLLLAGYFGQKFLPHPKPKIVGIDLGTTYSCVGAYQAVTGKVNIIPDSNGHLCIPSVVAYKENGDALVGREAMEQADHNPLNTFYDAKRFLGKLFTLEEFRAEADRYPFHIYLNDDGTVKFTTSHSSEKVITPEMIGAEIIKTLRKTAESHFEFPVKAAVVSVPAEFDARQRMHTKLAAEMAGLTVLRIINEPTAAALAYGLHNKTGAQDVLVVDLGGGTLDVSLLDIQGGMFLTRAMAGNNHLGGQDFNERLKAHLIEEIERRFGGGAEEEGGNLLSPEDVQSIRTAVENAKIDLTSNDTTSVKLKLTSFRRGARDLDVEVSRETFERINGDLFEKVLEPIGLVLEAAELDASEVDEIVLVGGSTRIPRVRERVSEFFSGKRPNVAIDPELAVVTGVSIQAGIIGGAWPLAVSAVESAASVKKIYVRH